MRERLGSQAEAGDALDVLGVGEHVYRGHVLETISTVSQNAKVAGERRRVAGYVGDLRRAELDDGV